MRFSTATAKPKGEATTGVEAKTEKERALIRKVSAEFPTAEIRTGSVPVPAVFGREFHVSAVIDGREVAHDYVSP